ncbi:MAG: hypothetical protein ACYC6A_24590 [Armatimonadota bacterium]
MKLKLHWYPEVVQRGADPNVGAQLHQLTSAALISHDIYCEERYTSADGSMVAFLRNALGRMPGEELWVCNLRTGEVAAVNASLTGYPTSNLFNDALYFTGVGTASDQVLMRLDLKTLELDEVFDMQKCPDTRYPVGSISPDERYYIRNYRVSEQVWGLFHVDLQRGTWETFHEHEDTCNPHPQFEPGKGEDILLQLNCGCVIDGEDNIIKLVGEEGAKLYVINKDGGNLRMLPVGTPHTPGVTGHECWVGNTGKVILTTGGGEIHLAAPGDEKSQLLWKGVPFMHISASVDGNYFLADDIANGKLYIGNIATGRLLPICDSGATCTSAQHSHPHAYMTPDNRFVIFNSDRTGLCQLWGAEIPAGFLDALDLPMPE